MKTKIYEIQINGEKEWVCADTVIEALKAYCSITDMSLVDFENDDEIIEVPKDKWGDMSIVDVEAERDEDGDFPLIMSFREYMEKEATSADIIASTNW